MVLVNTLAPDVDRGRSDAVDPATLTDVEPFYRTIIGVARTLFAAQGLKFTISGAEHIPATGGAVVAMNHTGYMDFTYAGIPARETKRYIRFMAKKEVFDNKISGPMMRAMKHIPVDRGDAGDSYRLAVEALRRGDLVGVFPEETISRSFELKDFRSGAARMALEAGVPVVPMVLWGSQRVWTKGHPKRLGRTNTPITIIVGAPIEPYEPAVRDDRTAAHHHGADAAGSPGEVSPRAGRLLGAEAARWFGPESRGSEPRGRSRRGGTSCPQRAGTCST